MMVGTRVNATTYADRRTPHLQSRPFQRKTRRWQIYPHLVVLILIVLSVYPMLFTLFASVKSDAQFYTSFWLPRPPYAWANYSEAWAVLSGGLFNSVIVCVVTLGGTLLMSSLAAWSFARYEFVGKEVAYYLILALLMVPGFLTLVPLYTLMLQYGLLGTLPGVFLPYLASSQVLSIFLLRSFFEGLPQELFDCARIDGAGELRILMQIGLPLSVPVLATLGILTTLATWNDFFWPLVAAGTNDSAQTVMVRAYNLTGGTNATPHYGLQTAALVLTSVPMVLLFLVGSRYYISGLTTGALKD